MSEGQHEFSVRRQSTAALTAERLLDNAASTAEQLVTTAATAERAARHTTLIPVISAALIALGMAGGWVWTMASQASTVSQSVSRMDALSARDNILESGMTDIKVHLGKIDTQLDYIVDAVKQQQMQHLPPRP